MNRKLGIIALVILLAAGAVWLFQKPEVPAPAPKVAEAPKPAPDKIEAPKLAKAAIAAPVAPPAVAKDAPATTPAKSAGDPQAELNTTLTDMVSLLQSGDMLTAFHRYMPPDFIAKMPPQQLQQIEQGMQQEMSQPEAQQGVQMMVTVLQNMQTMTPAMNETGDKATYQIMDPSGQSTKPEPFTLKKIDGKWYVDPESMGGM